jgi:hypothetical protein
MIATMLVIRQGQMHVFGVDSRARFEQGIAWHFLKTYPRECRQAGGPDAVAKLVAAAVERALHLGFTAQEQVSLFVALRFILGIDFDRDPQIPWAGQMLHGRKIRNPSLRINAIYDRMLEYLGETAGDHCEFVVRAMIRLRDWDIATAPPLDDKWTPNMLELLHGMYPQKFDYQGAEGNRYLLDDSIMKCDFFYGVQSSTGRALFTILMFMLGSGFDRDHLHPWAARILTDTKLVREQDRVNALYQEARAHLQESLTSKE